MENLSPMQSITEEKLAQTRKNFGPGQHVAQTIEQARTLIEEWERVEPDDMPRSAVASSKFYLPFLPKLSGDSTPHVAQWRKEGIPNGILIGRFCIKRPQVKLGKFHFPMPRLRTLSIPEGGLKALSNSTANQQAEYLRQLLSGGTIDCIFIQRLPIDSSIGNILACGLRNPGDGNPVLIGQWFTEMNDDNGKPIVRNSAKTRSSFRRMDRKLCKHFDNQVKVQEFRSREHVESFIKAAAVIGKSSYQHGMGIGVQANSWWTQMLDVHADSGTLRAYLLEAGGKPIAYAVGSLQGNTYTGLATSYLPEYRPVSPGSYLLRRMIEQFQLEGVRWFDYGFGDYSYKEIYGTWRREVASLNLYGESPTAKLAGLLDTVVKKTNHALYRALEQRGLLERLKRLRRQVALPLNKPR